jgi:arylsulfatase A-like enzyme
LAESRNAICLVIDGWQAGFAGPYGNSWINTPAINRLAAEGFVFDHALVDSPHLDRLYRSFWRGVHAAVPDDRLPAGEGLAARLASAGFNTTLVIDEPRVAEHPSAKEFREIVRLDPARATSSAADIAGTQLAEFFSQVLDRLEAADEPYLLWAHTSSLTNCWDAPLEYRERYLERDDASGADERVHLAAEIAALDRVGVVSPAGRYEASPDPDELLALRRAYAAQVSVFDACLAGLLEALDQMPDADRTLLFVAGARGFPLGEHRRIGLEIDLRTHSNASAQAAGDALHAELIHVPWLWRLPKQKIALGRSQALVQPADCCATLADWWGLSEPARANADRLGIASGRSVLPLLLEEESDWRDRALLTLNDQLALRTASWFLRKSGIGAEAVPNDSGAPPLELFVTPDDRWEQNEISNRCEAVAATLAELADEYRQALHTGEPAELTELSAEVQAGVS